MTQNIVTKSKIMSYAYNNVYDTINNRSNIADPKNTNNTTRKFVLRKDPWSKGNDYEGYPYIVFAFYDTKREYSKFSLDGKHKTIGWEFKGTIRTKDEGATNNTGETNDVTNMQDIQDDLDETFNSETVKQTLRVLNMFNFDIITEEGDEAIDGNGKHIYETPFTIKCYTRMKVSE